MNFFAKKIPLITAFMITSLVVSAQHKVMKSEVKPFDKRLVTTASSGVKSHVEWAKFPSKDVKIRKILLKLTLATPDEDYMSCAHWDYRDKLYVRRTSASKGESMDYEIARMLTPYGGNNPKGWGFTWEVDVTDFASILRDSVELDYIHTGWEPSEDRGWALTTDFEITYGEPAYEHIATHKVYDGGFSYGDAKNNIENHLKEFELKTSPKTNYVRNVIIQTGHGMDSMGNSEFAPKWRKLFWDGKEVSHKVLWTEGGDNPFYPQAGTWIYDRGNWIPGMLIIPDVCDMLVKGNSSYKYDMNMEPYVINTPSAEQNIVSYLIEYKVNKSKFDVELFDIVAPSNKDIHRRKNPTAEFPIIVIKNHSAQPVTSLNIEYGIEGGKKFSEKWVGNIAPFGVAEITLSNFIENDCSKSKSVFVVDVKSVNGKKDSFAADNKIYSEFTPIKVHKGNFVINFAPNNVSNRDNSIVLRNIKTGEKFIDYKIGSIVNGKRIKDSVTLPDGDYSFEVDDKTGDGLSFWANKKAGDGDCFITTPDNLMVAFFNPDFGNTIRYRFRVDSKLAEENLLKEPVIKISYLKRNIAVLKYIVNNKEKPITVIIRKHTGQIVTNVSTLPSKDGKMQFDMRSFPVGRYFIEVWQGEYKAFSTINVSEDKK